MKVLVRSGAEAASMARALRFVDALNRNLRARPRSIRRFRFRDASRRATPARRLSTSFRQAFGDSREATIFVMSQVQIASQPATNPVDQDTVTRIYLFHELHVMTSAIGTSSKIASD
jgi:hypothetical protein